MINDYIKLYVFGSIKRQLDVVFVEYLDIAILAAKSITCGLCVPS